MTFKMRLSTRVYIVLILTLLTILDPISGKRSFGGGSRSGSHSYPSSHRSGGLSGGGHGYPSSGGLSGGSHGYPSSGGHSGSSGSHGYPSSSGGLSGGGHGYPSSSGGLSGGGHGYPSSSGGLSGGNRGSNSGYPSSGGNRYPSSSGNTHTYPSSSNNHGYPSGGGLSGGGHSGSAYKPAVHHTTNVYNYHYTPPARISYASHGGAPVNYPVYRGTPPTYVYQYKNSNSKYGTLLAGLALMNLGTLGVAGYALHQANQNHGSGGGGGGGAGGTYKAQPGEICKFAIKKENGDYEETKIDCQIISGFIYEDMQTHNAAKNSTVTTTTTVTNVTTIVNTTNVGNQTTTAPPVLYSMLPNGTLVPVNATLIQNNAPVVQNNTASPGSVVVTTTTTNTTLVNALEVKGKPVDVTPGMQCFVIRQSPVHNMRKNIPCGLLQTYADRSLQRNSAARHVPMFTIAAAILAYCIA